MEDDRELVPAILLHLRQPVWQGNAFSALALDVNQWQLWHHHIRALAGAAELLATVGLKESLLTEHIPQLALPALALIAR
jgi:hypothetical protein